MVLGWFSVIAGRPFLGNALPVPYTKSVKHIILQSFEKISQKVSIDRHCIIQFSILTFSKLKYVPLFINSILELLKKPTFRGKNLVSQRYWYQSNVSLFYEIILPNPIDSHRILSSSS